MDKTFKDNLMNRKQVSDISGNLLTVTILAIALLPSDQNLSLWKAAGMQPPNTGRSEIVNFFNTSGNAQAAAVQLAPHPDLEAKALPLDFLLSPKGTSLPERILARLLQAEAHEVNPHYKDDYRQTFIALSLALKEKHGNSRSNTRRSSSRTDQVVRAIQPTTGIPDGGDHCLPERRTENIFQQSSPTGGEGQGAQGLSENLRREGASGLGSEIGLALRSAGQDARGGEKSDTLPAYFIEASYTMYGLHPDLVWPRIQQNRHERLRHEFGQWFDSQGNRLPDIEVPKKSSCSSPVAQSADGKPVAPSAFSKKEEIA